jgi:Rrf2 family protein
MRLELTRKTDLALQALQALLRDGALRKGGDLAATLGTSAAFLSQALTPLTGAGWVRSVPGPRGGYQATGAAADVSVLQLIEAVEGPVADDRCVLREQPCPAPVQCALHDAWIPARDALVAHLAATPVVAALHGRKPEGMSNHGGADPEQ